MIKNDVQKDLTKKCQHMEYLKSTGPFQNVSEGPDAFCLNTECDIIEINLGKRGK